MLCVCIYVFICICICWLVVYPGAGTRWRRLIWIPMEILVICNWQSGLSCRRDCIVTDDPTGKEELNSIENNLLVNLRELRSCWRETHQQNVKTEKNRLFVDKKNNYLKKKSWGIPKSVEWAGVETEVARSGLVVISEGTSSGLGLISPAISSTGK